MEFTKETMLDKLERKLGTYAIPRLMNWFIGGYVIGYILMAISGATNSGILSLMTLEPYYILHGQIWRLVTWILIPGDGGSINLFTLIMLFFYYSIGTNLERTWGTFYYNVYLFNYNN